METLKAIHARRAIRKFKDKTVPEDILKKILSAGMQAPSAHNEQPWQFVVVKEKETMKKMQELSPWLGMRDTAPVAILVCGDLNLEKAKGYWVQDCSACAMLLWMAAHDLGLGAVWCGIYPREDRVKGFQKITGLPKNVIPLCLMPIGYPDEKKPKEDRYNPERIHKEKW